MDGRGPSDESGDEVDRVLDAATSLLPGGGERRSGQRQMAHAVSTSVAGERHLIVQAGTGTGKSLAYLVPAALSGQRVVVATATKALQDQLAGNDLPLVSGAIADTVGADLTFAVLKGRSNYLCRQRLSEVGGHGAQLSLDAASADAAADPPDTDDPLADAARSGSGVGAGAVGDATDATAVTSPVRFTGQLRRLIRWAEDTPSGDRAELDFEPHYRVWAMVSTSARECPGAHRCPSGRDCFAEHARARAQAADVVVVNTHLYGAHLASGGAVLPPHDLVVFDEVHDVEAVMTDSLGVEITPGRFRALAASARPLLDTPTATSSVEAVADLGDSLQRLLEPLAGQRVPSGSLETGGAPADGGHGPPPPPDRPAPGGTGVAAEPPGLELGLGDGGHGPMGRSGPTGRSGPAEEPGLGVLLALAGARVTRLVDQLRQAEREAGPGEDQAARSRRDRVLLAADHLAADLRRVSELTDNDVVWVDGGGRAGDRPPGLKVSPIDVGPVLAERLWETVTGVLTSATVPVTLGPQLGLPAGGYVELDVGSPFDYQEHALLYVARSLPDRRLPESEGSLHDELEALITAAGGRTLALFTSWRAMRAAAEALVGRLPFPILTQAELPKPALIEALGDDEATCLFATLSFWQGVDIPGRTLSLVAIDRIPFPRPGEPVSEARRERAGPSAFNTVDLPRAGTLLAQGAGRLIRSASDRGVVAVLDSRLATATYRRTLLARVPPMRRTVDRSEVERFLRQITQA